MLTRFSPRGAFFSGAWGYSPRFLAPPPSRLPGPRDYFRRAAGFGRAAHTSWPLGRLVVRDFVTDTGNDEINNVDNTTRDIVMITSEATAHFCSEFRHLTFMTVSSFLQIV
jgi:hypothetical protein